MYKVKVPKCELFFNSVEDALKVPIEIVHLVRNKAYTFNKVFNNINYSDFELNENSYYLPSQGKQGRFQEHMNDVIDFLRDKDLLNGPIIEIGCGNGNFIEELKKRGYSSVIGYDPTYKGEEKNIIKSNFPPNEALPFKPELIILRHVLEHIPYPYDFLSMLSKQFSGATNIYIEVPCFDWIVTNKAFFDITYLHCNYFNAKCFDIFFSKCEIKHLFDNQYLGVVANTFDLYNSLNLDKNEECDLIDLENAEKNVKDIITGFNTKIALWGASSKGILLANILDPLNNKIEFLIDIDTNKQNKYISTSGHKVVSPDSIFNISELTIIVVNENYYKNIQARINNKTVKLVSINELIEGKTQYD